MAQHALVQIRADLHALADTGKAENCRRFFKTGTGEYGEGDRFIGVDMPDIRTLVRTYADLTRPDALSLLVSAVHEERMLGLLILVQHFKKGKNEEQREIYQLYMNHTEYINGWDLVDVTAPHIVGAWLWDKPRKPLYRFAASPCLWERRIAILATFYFIRENDFADTLTLAERLLQDEQDLIHKAVGWMLREVGNRDRPVAEAFLAAHYQHMPRTMLRYAIEKFPEGKRQAFLKGRV